MSHNWSEGISIFICRVQPRQAAIQFSQSIEFNNTGNIVGLAARTQVSVCKSPLLSTGTAVCPCSVQKLLVETTVSEEGQNPVAGLWGRTLGEN